MVVPLSTIPVQELRAADGQAFAVVVASEEFARMQAELAALREQVATLQRQKNYYVGELTRVLQTTIPVPHTQAELDSAVPNSDELHRIIGDLEAR